MPQLPRLLVTILVSVFTGLASAWGQFEPLPQASPAWHGAAALSAAFYVEQRQWPAGYGIRLHVPDRRTADIHVSVEGNSLRIHSQGGGQLAPRGLSGPVFTQFGSFSQSLTLPVDADVRQMQVNSRGGVIEIFISRRR